MSAANGSAAARDLENERDARLIRFIGAGDRLAFEELYRRYFHRLERFLGRLTRRRDLAEEVINDTLWVVWRKAGEFRGSSQVSTWIMGIAYRSLLKSLRVSGAEPVESLPDDEMASDDGDAMREQTDWLAAGLRHLPLEQYLSLKLAYGFGHSLEEIAEIMDCPLGTVKARMFHARVKLRNLLPVLAGGNERRAS